MRHSWNLRFVCCSLAMIAFHLEVSEGSANDADARPNFVFILADDLGYGDLACYGRTDIKTPHLDKLAEQGVKLTNHYANGAECTPTRTAFLTGRYQQWVGGLECAIGTGNVGRYDDAIRLRDTNDLGLPASEPTLGQILKQAGYATALCGKWHLGYEPKFGPNHHGFDHAFYCIGGGMDYFYYLDNVAGYNLFLNGDPIARDGYFTDLATDDAIRFLMNRPDNKPFFLYLPYTCPHSPFQGPKDKDENPLPLDSPLWNQGSAPPDVYLAMIEYMDKRIGDVLKVLDERNLSENTVVFFASDNGGTRSARNFPLSGIKGSTLEGGIRVPGIIRWTNHLPAGLTSDQPCLTFDFTKSIVELAKADWPSERPLEGIDIVSQLQKRTDLIDRTLYWRKQRGDKVWKAVRDGSMKYVAEQTANSEKEYLFDLATDVAEKNDLKSDQTEEFQRLRAVYHDWETEVRKDRRGRPLEN